MTTESLTVPAPSALASPSITSEQKDLLKRTLCRGATDDEFLMFLEVCKRRRIDPFSKMLYLVPRWDSKLGREVMAVQSSIDYFRLTAGRSDKYAGQVGPQWCGENGEWKDVWLSKDPPRAARVGVMCVDFKEPLYAIALWDAYVQKTKDGKPAKFWLTMGSLMLGKCAEALAIRRAFPEDLAGLYTPEEMSQAEVEHVQVDTRTGEIKAPVPSLPERPPAQAPRTVEATASVRPASKQEQPASSGPDFNALPEYHEDGSVTVFKAIRVPKDIISLWGRWKQDKAAKADSKMQHFRERTWLEVSNGSVKGGREETLQHVVTRNAAEIAAGTLTDAKILRWVHKAAWTLHVMYDDRQILAQNAEAGRFEDTKDTQGGDSADSTPW